mmetsp:Transcript_5025/g.7679  ORF Transcript_5025/g.7679 Transcript_5025/m.7679 type:complete len:126 (+) Transcript_5025:75-452(+)|eukprot:CAMPEP_0185019530 /NCGR_PEP_ID=MMETSP1103-20130426/2144_1 /TAXON_ID=36769 /ORGANISM="Paraphysomonas bandaiensis, Strain Caron Lab Isolate" /LENGTH=125 /DNA_ID=CAMNT_0027549901 /DNA_START=54 /DNA_END=431 /DNA_ORIENTATION=-
MAQGSMKKRATKPVARSQKSAKITKQILKAKKKTKKGSSVQLPNSKFREEAELDRRLSQAINKSNEQKIAAKVIQAGGKIGTSDIMQRGKELSKEQRRSQVKKKVTRVEEKLKAITEKAEREGKI